MSKLIELADYRDITPKEDEIRMPEDGFVTLGLSLCGDRASEHDLVSAHKWLSLAAMRGSHQARVHRLKVSRRLNADQIARAQSQLHAFASARA
jgi:TPR repeat protein